VSPDDLLPHFSSFRLTFLALFAAPYEREVLEINKKMGLSDGGAGVRSLVKVRRAHSPSLPFPSLSTSSSCWELEDCQRIRETYITRLSSVKANILTLEVHLVRLSLSVNETDAGLSSLGQFSPSHAHRLILELTDISLASTKPSLYTSRNPLFFPSTTKRNSNGQPQRVPPSFSSSKPLPVDYLPI